MDFSELLLQNFDKTSIVKQRQIFFKTEKNPKESFDQYLTNLQNLANTCNFLEKDNMIRDVIILGIRNADFRKEILAKPDLTLEKVIREFRLREIMLEKLNEKKMKVESQAKNKPSDEKLKEFQITLDELKNCLDQTTQKIQIKNKLDMINKEKAQQQQQNKSKTSRVQIKPSAPATDGKPGSNKSKIEVILCHKCKTTHPKYHCPQFVKTNTEPTTKFCTDCKKVGHFNRDCQNKGNNARYSGGGNSGNPGFRKNKNIPKGTPANVNLHGWNPPRTKTSQHQWVHCYGEVPPLAVHAGHDTDGDPIYVGKSNHNGDWLPAKVIPRKHTAYVCWGGQEVVVGSYEVLCGAGYTWQPCYAGNIPPTAVTTGTTTTGEPLYVGRGHWNGSLTPGKIHPSHRCLYIPYGGQEVRLDTYEVLIQQPILTWMPSSGTALPMNAIHAGHDSDGDQIYVGRSYHEGDLLPAKVIVNKGCAYVCHGGGEHMKHQFEILCGTNYRWIPSTNGHVPSNSVEGGRTSGGEQLYIGRGHHCGSVTPGKIHPSHQCLYIPYGGQEIRLSNYEVLTRM